MDERSERGTERLPQALEERLAQIVEESEGRFRDHLGTALNQFEAALKASQSTTQQALETAFASFENKARAQAEKTTGDIEQLAGRAAGTIEKLAQDATGRIEKLAGSTPQAGAAPNWLTRAVCGDRAQLISVLAILLGLIAVNLAAALHELWPPAGPPSPTAAATPQPPADASPTPPPPPPPFPPGNLGAEPLMKIVTELVFKDADRAILIVLAKKEDLFSESALRSIDGKFAGRISNRSDAARLARPLLEVLFLAMINRRATAESKIKNISDDLEGIPSNFKSWSHGCLGATLKRYEACLSADMGGSAPSYSDGQLALFVLDALPGFIERTQDAKHPNTVLITKVKDSFEAAKTKAGCTPQ